LPDPPDLSTGPRLLEEYIVREALGEGAFGVVYACTCRSSGEEVAVKMVDKVETPVVAIRREAEVMKSLSHPNIVRFHAVFFERCFVCIVMDKYAGGDLVEGMQHHHEAKKEKLNGLDIVHISSQMGAAIQYLHSKSIAHRDIKGDNFLIDRKDITDPECHIALSDFGSAAVVGPNERLNTSCGTRILWAPEMYSANYGLKVDIWAMGVVMYGLLDGRFPFKDEHDIKTKEPKYSRRLHPVCQDFISLMLQKNELERGSADDVMAHGWLSESTERQGGVDISTQARTDTKNDDDDIFLCLEEVHGGVVERRRELVERLEDQHAQGPTTASFAHRASLGEFLVPDRRLAGACCQYQWWDEAEVFSAGLLGIGVGVERTLSEVSRDFDRSPHIVGQLLKDHNIDITQFGVGEAKTLEQLASEVQSGSARLMLDATCHRKLVRVVDVVLLRLFSGRDEGSPLLIETGEQYPDGRRRQAFRMPGTKKFPHENAQETAMRVLKDTMGMGQCAVHFAFDEKEVYEEEMDSPSFPGVRTVYRKEIVQCYVEESNKETLEKVGLGHVRSYCAEDDKHNVKFLSWMSQQEVMEHKVKLRAEGSEEVSGLVLPPVGLNEQDLARYLESHNIDISQFGQNGTKSLKNLSKELICADSFLLTDANGEVLRVLDQVMLQVVSPSGKILVCSAHVSPDGTRKEINMLPSSKGRPDESQFVTARRILRKQIRIDESQVKLDPTKSRICEEFGTASNLPWIKTVIRRRFIFASLMM